MLNLLISQLDPDFRTEALSTLHMGISQNEASSLHFSHFTQINSKKTDLLENSIQGEDIHELSYLCLHLSFIKEMTLICFQIWPHQCL